MHHREIRLLAEDFGEVGPQPAGGGAGVELGLHHDLPADDVKGSPKRSIAEVSALRQQGFVTSS